jgi:hypothetical protein
MAMKNERAEELKGDAVKRLPMAADAPLYPTAIGG